MNLDFVFRGVLMVLLCFAIWHETGPFTVLFAALVFIFTEIQNFLNATQSRLNRSLRKYPESERKRKD